MVSIHTPFSTCQKNQRTMARCSAMTVSLNPATAKHAGTIARLRSAANDHLTRSFGRGPWSSNVTERGVFFALRTAHVFVGRDGRAIIGTLTLSTKKPWSIDPSYFTDCRRPLYLTAMAVHPSRQRDGLGRAMLEDVKRVARAWPADAVRLDAYDLPGGAGDFYARCGYREIGRATYRKTPLIYYELLL